jgi:hypothetical protein
MFRKMSSRKSVMSIAALVLCAAAVPSDRSSSKQPDIETVVTKVGGSHFLGKELRKKLERLALAGDLRASYCVANYYAYVANSGNPDRLYWILIAAENGDANAMMKISLEYQNGKDLRSRERAEFWRLRAEATRSQENVICD